MRVIFKFEKRGANRFISHLDLMRTLQRALRRAQLPVAYSQGYNPRMILSLAAALGLGCESVAEVLDMRFEQDIAPSEATARFNEALPEGIRMLAAREIPQQGPALTALLSQASYQARVKGDYTAQVLAFKAAESCVILKQNKKGARQTDIKPLVCYIDAHLEGEDTVIVTTLVHTASQALNPDLLLRALGVEEGAKILRTGLYGTQNDAPVDLFDMEYAP